MYESFYERHQIPIHKYIYFLDDNIFLVNSIRHTQGADVIAVYISLIIHTRACYIIGNVLSCHS